MFYIRHLGSLLSSLAKADRKKLKCKEVSNWPKVTDLISDGVKDSKLEVFNTEMCCVP